MTKEQLLEENLYVKRLEQFKKYAHKFYTEKKTSEEFPYGINAIDVNDEKNPIFYKHDNIFHNEFILVKDIPTTKIVFDIITLGDGREVYWLHDEKEMDLHPEDMYMCEYGFQEIMEGYIREGREYINYTEFDDFITGIEEEMKKEKEDKMCEEMELEWDCVKEDYIKQLPNIKHFYDVRTPYDDDRGIDCEGFIREQIISNGYTDCEEYFKYMIETYGAEYVNKELAKYLD